MLLVAAPFARAVLNQRGLQRLRVTCRCRYVAVVVLELGEYVMHEIMDCSEKFLRERNLEEQGGERSKAAEVRWPVLFCLARAPLPSKIDIRVLMQMRRVSTQMSQRVSHTMHRLM